MITKITLLITLLAYSMIVSQSFMYILSLRRTQLTLGPNAYIEIRKRLDANMRANFKYPVYLSLLSNLFLLVVTIQNPGSTIFITSTIAFVALVADTFITVKGNLPVNDIINSWSMDSYPANWTEYRAKWLLLFQYRQIANITGFISLLIGAVFG
jgi:uncharacterized membrane protein